MSADPTIGRASKRRDGAKGYIVADRWWRDLISALDWLRRERGMNVVLLAHSAIETINDPRAPTYTSYQLRLHKRARGLIADEMDLIAFLSTEVHVVSEDLGFSKTRTPRMAGLLATATPKAGRRSSPRAASTCPQKFPVQRISTSARHWRRSSRRHAGMKLRDPTQRKPSK